MQLLGAWMISTPLARAAAIAWFIAGASSPTRRVAPWHQCWSHMSQMMMAVFAGLPLDRLLLDREGCFDPVAGTASRSRACSTSGLLGVRPPGNQENPAHQHDHADRAEPDPAHELEPPREPRLARTFDVKHSLNNLLATAAEYHRVSVAGWSGSGHPVAGSRHAQRDLQVLPRPAFRNDRGSGSWEVALCVASPGGFGVHVEGRSGDGRRGFVPARTLDASSFLVRRCLLRGGFVSQILIRGRGARRDLGRGLLDGGRLWR